MAAVIPGHPWVPGTDREDEEADAAQSADHVSSYFTMLRAELGFYVSCLNLHDELSARSLPVTFPDPRPWSQALFSCEDLRDTSLALRTENVIGNDVDADGKQLVIITGANSGGKSTFLRSTGLARLMMQAGQRPPRRTCSRRTRWRPAW